jgi:hypothetical protein
MIAQFPESVRGMPRAKCAAFAEAITTLTNLTPNDPRVTNLFDKYGKTIGNGYLILEHELQQFYLDQSHAKDEVVRQNLGHQGIGADLKPTVDWTSKTYENDDRIVKDASILPRVKLSQNHNLF